MRGDPARLSGRRVLHIRRDHHSVHGQGRTAVDGDAQLTRADEHALQRVMCVRRAVAERADVDETAADEYRAADPGGAVGHRLSFAVGRRH